MKYENLDNVISLVQKIGENSLIAKLDIENASRIMPIDPNDYHLLGFTFGQQYFYDRCLPMGCSTSCQTFEKFSQALQWLLINHFEISGITHILDDFIFVGPSNSNLCRSALETFLVLAEDVKVPIKKEKTVLPTTCRAVHGVLIDTVKLEVRLPIDKIEKIREMLINIKNRRTVKLNELQSLLGLLSFACSVIVPGSFLRRLYNLTCGTHRPHHYVNKSAKLDMEAWFSFLKNFTGIRFFLNDVWVSSDKLLLYPDASSTIGYAAVFVSKWFAVRWHKSFSSADICLLELFPIMLAVEIWGEKMSNSSVVFLTHNEALVAIINKQTSKFERIMKLLRQFVLSCMYHNILFEARYMREKETILLINYLNLIFRKQKR